MLDAQYIDDVVTTYTSIAIASGNKLIFATQSGLISGIPIFDDDDDILPIQETYFKMFAKHRKSFKTDYLQSITLKDVSVSSANTNYNLPYLTIFMDKVLGVSIGNPD